MSLIEVSFHLFSYFKTLPFYPDTLFCYYFLYTELNVLTIDSFYYIYDNYMEINHCRKTLLHSPLLLYLVKRRLRVSHLEIIIFKSCYLLKLSYGKEFFRQSGETNIFYGFVKIILQLMII